MEDKDKSSWEKQELLVLDMLNKLSEDQKDLIRKTSEYREETIVWRSQADSRTDRIEIDLREHKEGVIQNRKAMKLFNNRLEIIEEPGKAKAFLYEHGMKTLKFIAALGAAVAVVGKYLKWF